jgi:protein-disulfide isomerase
VSGLADPATIEPRDFVEFDSSPSHDDPLISLLIDRIVRDPRDMRREPTRMNDRSRCSDVDLDVPELDSMPHSHPDPDPSVIDSTDGVAGASAARRTAPGDRLVGRPSAPVQVVLYGDLTSRRSAATYLAIRDAMTRDSSIVLAHRHLICASEPTPRRAAEAVEAADDQGEFWPMCDLLYRVGADPSSIVSHCRALGLDERSVRESVLSRRHSARIAHDLRRAADAGAHASPTMFVNGVRWPTDDPYRCVATDLADLAHRANPLWSRWDQHHAGATGALRSSAGAEP